MSNTTEIPTALTITPAVEKRAWTMAEYAETRAADAKAAYLEAIEENGIAYATQWKLAGTLHADATHRLTKGFVIGTLQGFVHQTEQRLAYLNRGESKSSSAMSNLVEDIESQARLEIYSALVEAATYEN